MQLSFKNFACRTATSVAIACLASALSVDLGHSAEDTNRKENAFGNLVVPVASNGVTPSPFTIAVYRALLRAEADRAKLPVDLAEAVMAVESSYDATSIGTVGEIGLMQVRVGTAAFLGFKGGQVELARPDLNIHYGVAYLAGAWRATNGDLCKTLMKYRSGYGNEIMTPLSVSYCQRAHAHLAALHSPLATLPLNVSPATFAAAEPSTVAVSRPIGQAAPAIRTDRVSKRFWAAEEARVRAISARLHSKWRRLAAR